MQIEFSALDLRCDPRHRGYQQTRGFPTLASLISNFYLADFRLLIRGFPTFASQNTEIVI
jgi:hypothetical protein